MANPTNHWKLGLFVVVAFVIALGTMVALGAHSLQKKTVGYKSYFDESVQGLDVGSPVKFRGVTVGNVSIIDIAPDHRNVEVTLELGVTELDNLALNTAKVNGKARINVPPDLRVQLASAGITGVKFILIDFFPVKDNPPPVLPFPVPDNYIPAARSTMKNLEDAVVHAVNRLPEVADEILRLLVKVSQIMEQVEDRHLPDKAVVTLGKINELVVEVQSNVHGLNAGKLSVDAQKAIANLDAMVGQLNALIARVQGDKGVMVSVERASNAVGEVAKNATGLGLELEETLRDVQEAAGAIQRLGDQLDRDGDMLLKGRSRKKGQ
jgi:phospholipid/cholesterol/gamma-HCH transport system substrate-binding protein